MISDPGNQQRLEQTFSFLRKADAAFHRRFMGAASLVQLKQGQYICQEGRSCTHLALIIQGSARVFKLGDNGREITLYRIGPGQSCILTASCILSQQPFPAFAVCETDVEAATIPAADVRRWLSESEVWRDYIFGLVSRRLASIINVVEEVVFKRMDRRIADYLTTRVQTSNEMLHATHQQIASDLGTSREVVSRILKDLESNDLLRVSRGTIQILDLPGLSMKAEST